MPQELSGGMARRVALARALVLDPPLMLYDEPLTGLDPIARGVIVALIRGLNRTLGLTSLVISHDVSECLAIADRALVVAGGRVAFSGTPSELAATRDPALRQFLDGTADGPIAFDYAARGATTHA
jgi:phospholipid/cholesterol/gamma-HCH transport system ATP-binding protein